MCSLYQDNFLQSLLQCQHSHAYKYGAGKNSTPESHYAEDTVRRRLELSEEKISFILRQAQLSFKNNSTSENNVRLVRIGTITLDNGLTVNIDETVIKTSVPIEPKGRINSHLIEDFTFRFV